MLLTSEILREGCVRWKVDVDNVSGQSFKSIFGPPGGSGRGGIFLLKRVGNARGSGTYFVRELEKRYRRTWLRVAQVVALPTRKSSMKSLDEGVITNGSSTYITLRGARPLPLQSTMLTLENG